jgi:uncharacterized protein
VGFLSHKKDRTGASLSARRREVEGVRTRALEERRVAAHDVQAEGTQVFRRNRTLSNAEKAPLNSVSPRAIHHHLRGKRRSLTMLLMGSIALVCVLTFVLYQLSAQFTVSLYGSIDSISDENQASYRATINRYLAERPSERLRILLDTDSLSNYLQMHGHSEVSDVTAVHGIGLGKTEVEIKVREPVARWTVDGNLQYVDNSGVVFSNNYYKSPSIQIVDKSGVSLDVARQWGIGDADKDKGVLLLVVMNDRNVRIEVGRGLEGDLTDVESGRIIRTVIAPEFRKGNYANGLSRALDSITAQVEGIADPNQAVADAPVSDFDPTFLVFMGFWVFPWLGAILARSKSWWAGGLIGGGLGLGVAGLLGWALWALIGAGVLAVLGLLFDFFVSKNYRSRVSRGENPAWWAGGSYWGSGSGGGSGGGGSSGLAMCTSSIW